MGIRSDVIVIGGGMAGLMAGIGAARTGATVTLVTATESSLRQASGLIDVLGYPSPESGPVVRPIDAVDALPEDHPYRCLGTEAIERGIAAFDEIAGDLYEGSVAGHNALMPTAAGTLKPTTRYQTTMAAGLASDDRDAAIIGFEGIPALDGPLAADWLAGADVPFAVTGDTCVFPGGFRTDAAVTRYARALDRDEPVEIDGMERPARLALAETMAPVIGSAERVGVPALLGLEQPLDVLATLEAHLGVDVFEIPTGPPSVPGMRLATLLADSFLAAGGRYHEGAPVVEYDDEGDRIASVFVNRNERLVAYEADQFVLATGGLVGKGISADRDSVTEPVFDCHVSHPDERYDWFEDDVFGRHAYPRFGVTVDDSLRPQEPDGTPEYRNLRAAGAVIGGYDFPAELSGSGVSITTGWAAGKAAGGACS